MTKFQEFIKESIRYSSSKIEKEALASFATVDGEVAEEVTDLSDDQIFHGEHFINDFSDYLTDQNKYYEKLL